MDDKISRFGLFGHPVAHSFSPSMHEAAFKHCGISATYDVFDVLPEDLDGKLSALASDQIVGANVTVPHKVHAYNFIKAHGHVDREAEKYGAVNTIYFKKNTLCGTNTDGTGFLRALRDDLGFEYNQKRIFVIGAGGAARAIVIALGEEPQKIIINDIRSESVESLIKDYRALYKPEHIEGYADGDPALRQKIIGKTDLLINATGIGMHVDDEPLFDYECLEPPLAVFDVIYNPFETSLLKMAKERGCSSINGLGMLLYQGAESFRIWTGVEPPVDVMREALIERVKNMQP